MKWCTLIHAVYVLYPWLQRLLCLSVYTADLFHQQTNGNNSARQTRDTTTNTWIAYGNSTWRASKYKVYKLHQRYILKKGWPQWHIYPPFQAHSATQVCTGIRQTIFFCLCFSLFFIWHSPLIAKDYIFSSNIFYTAADCCHTQEFAASAGSSLQLWWHDWRLPLPACHSREWSCQWE